MRPGAGSLACQDLSDQGVVASSTGARLGGGLDHRLGDAVGAEHDPGPVRGFGKLLDEDRALVLEALDDVTVVDDLVPQCRSVP